MSIKNKMKQFCRKQDNHVTVDGQRGGAFNCETSVDAFYAESIISTLLRKIEKLQVYKNFWNKMLEDGEFAQLTFMKCHPNEDNCNCNDCIIWLTQKEIEKFNR